MTALPLTALDQAAAPARRRETPDDAWQKAMARFEAGQQRAERASKAHSDADEAMFAARARLEAFKPPASLTVQINCELYFDDGVKTLIDRRYSNDLDLRDEAAIQAYAKDDAVARNFLLAELNFWLDCRAPAEAAYERAKAVSDAKEAASAVATDRSNALQLRLLRTPSPSLRELLWKIEQLRKQDCDADTEELGWDYVLQELAVLSGKAGDATLN